MMRTMLRHFIFFFSFLGVVAGFLVAPGAFAKTSCGINYNFARITLSELSKCNQDNRNATIKGGSILLRIGEPEMVALVRKQLSEMKSSGLKSVRIIVWFSEGGLRGPNVFHAVRERTKAMRAVRRFSELTAEAGMERLFIAFGPQGISDPGCFRKSYGDCFQDRTLESSRRFVVDVAKESLRTGQTVIIDLHNEGCSARGATPLAKANKERFNDQIASAASMRLPGSTQFTLSIILEKGLSCVEESMRLLDRWGLRNPLVDVHVYSLKAVAMLPAAARIVKANGRRLIIGETSLTNSETLGALSRASTNDVDDILFWPSRGDGTCHVTVAPPYRPPQEIDCK